MLNIILLKIQYQMMLYKVLEDWGMDGFLKHAENTAELYKTKRDQCLAAMEKHLKGRKYLLCR